VLESYIKIQDTGFYWDLRYKKKVYENIEFVLFTPNLRVDTDEADKLCGHYSSQTSGVRNLCRYCTVPTLKSNLVTKNWEHKTVRMVKKLMDAEDFAGLRAISQQYIENALYCIRFGLHNGRGIHGATPLEMLHAILLGMFKYMNEFFLCKLARLHSWLMTLMLLPRSTANYYTVKAIETCRRPNFPKVSTREAKLWPKNTLVYC
jgi:hypothetical protein